MKACAVGFVCWLVLPVLAGLLAWALNHLALRKWRRAVQAHWTERARILYPVRVSAALNLLVLPCAAGEAARHCLPEPAVPFPTLELAAFALVLVANWPLHREMFPELRFVRWLHEVVLAGAMRMGHWIVLAAVWLLMPPAVDGQAWTLAAMTLLLHLGIAFGGLQRFLQACRLLAPAPERLHRIVASAQSTLPARPRHVWVSPTPLANAYAFPTTGDLLFTRKLLEVLSDEEIAAVTAHELGHLGESRAVVAGRLLASLVLYPWIFLTPAVASQSWLGVAGIALLSFGLLRFGRFLSQRMEKRADQIATGHQVAEGVYARALERLYAANHVPAVLPQKHKTHPDLYDRLVAAGAPPDYPRPAKPRRLGWSAWVPLIWLGIVLGLQLAQG